jgi:glycosyltransferase A (GT-A) superfamily protein (DUF2064 family)
MTDPKEITDAEFRLYQARDRAAFVYRKEGFCAFAERVEAGLQDECSQMRLALFIADPCPAHDQEFLTAWHEIADKENVADPRCGLRWLGGLGTL